MSEEKNMSLEETFEELENTIAKMEEKETNLEQSFELYQKGMSLLKNANEKIDRVEKRVKMMQEDGELVDFPDEDM